MVGIFGGKNAPSRPPRPDATTPVHSTPPPPYVENARSGPVYATETTTTTTHVVTTRPVLSSSAPQTAPAGVNRQYTLRITGCLIREQPIRSAPHPTLDTWSPHFSRAPTLAPRLLAHCSALHCPFYPAGHQPFTSLPPRRAPPRSAASPSRRSFPLLSDSSIRHFTDHCMFPPLPPVLVEHVIIYSLCTSRASYLYIHSP